MGESLTNRCDDKQGNLQHLLNERDTLLGGDSHVCRVGSPYEMRLLTTSRLLLSPLQLAMAYRTQEHHQK